MEQNHENQGKRKKAGETSEEFVRKLFHAEKSYCDDYDCLSKNLIVEVKSCESNLKSNSKDNAQRFGRFIIEMKNHIGLFLYAIMHNKIPVYVFVVRINNTRVWIKKSWHEVNPFILREHNQIAWYHFFNPPEHN